MAKTSLTKGNDLSAESDLNKFVLLAAVDNRPDLLRSCLRSLSFLKGWRLVFVGQEFSEARRQEVVSLARPESLFIWLDKKAGMHNAKLKGLQAIEEFQIDYVVASIDDDMEFLADTNFDRMAEIAIHQNVGLVSGNWVRSEKQLGKKKLSESQKSQAIVYTAGGLVFSKKIARLIIGLGENDYWCDNTEWSLASYLNGYQNRRYLGSLAIHRILSAGGRKSYVNVERQLPSDKYVLMRSCKKTLTDVAGFHIPDQRDLTPFAKFTHKINKK